MFEGLKGEFEEMKDKVLQVKLNHTAIIFQDMEATIENKQLAVVPA